jgi:hypothetical protein
VAEIGWGDLGLEPWHTLHAIAGDGIVSSPERTGTAPPATTTARRGATPPPQTSSPDSCSRSTGPRPHRCGARAVDLLIAARAMANDLALFTRNPDDFDHLEAVGLQVHTV